MRIGGLLPTCVGAFALVACTTSSEYTEQADLEVGALLAEVEEQTLGGRENWVLQPLPEKEPEPEPAAEPEPTPPADQGAQGEGAAVEGAGVEGAAAEGAEAPQQPEAAAPVDSEPSGSETTKTEGRASDTQLTAPLDSDDPAAVRLDLNTSLRTAFSSGRDYLDRKEQLYLDGLSLTLTRYNFGPLLNGTISTIWEDAEDSASTLGADANFGVSQILDSGGLINVGANFGINHLASAPGPSAGPPPTPGLEDPIYSGGLDVNLVQPLLRGSGYLVSHEALTQGERTIVYQVREFELFREDFAIEVARDFFDLVTQRRRFLNNEQAWKDAVFDRRKTEALRQVDRADDQSLFLSRRREIDAENDLLESRTNYEFSLDQFKIKLGLPTATPIVFVDEEPTVIPVRLDEESAVEVALNNRLDILTEREVVEDAERAIVIAEDALRPGLALTAGGELNAAGGAPEDAWPDTWSAHAGLTLELPLNRQAERNEWRAALIALDRSRRDYQLKLEEVEREVRNQLRQTKQREQQIELELEHIAQEQRSVAVTQIRYESGEIGSRDLIEARQALQDAQNALINLQAQHVILRLGLLRTLGLLFIDQEGTWKA